MADPLAALGIGPGDLLAGKYRVERTLAAGGMGVVVAAEHEALKQLVAIIENPVYRKYQQMDGEMTRSLQAKLVTELRATLEPKLKAFELAVAGRLGIPVTAPAAPSSARPPARAASN